MLHKCENPQKRNAKVEEVIGKRQSTMGANKGVLPGVKSAVVS
jgi:hypothetical protein